MSRRAAVSDLLPHANFLVTHPALARQILRGHEAPGCGQQNFQGGSVNFIHPQGQLRRGNNEFLIEFRDRNGQLVDVGNAKFDMDMNMPGMQMHSGGKIERTNTPGQYRAKIKIDMSGEWTAKISFQGPHGQGQQSFSVIAK